MTVNDGHTCVTTEGIIFNSMRLVVFIGNFQWSSPHFEHWFRKWASVSKITQLRPRAMLRYNQRLTLLPFCIISGGW